jgi:squalene monooxygenase
MQAQSLALHRAAARLAVLQGQLDSNWVSPYVVGHSCAGEQTMGHEEAEILIVGAGVAGSALAHALGELGHQVLVLERDIREPNRIVGELLQPGGVAALKALGLEEAVQNIDAQEVQGYAVMAPEKGVAVPLAYPVQEDNIRPRGWSFHHGRFIQQLRKAARTTPNVEVRQGTVTKLLKETPDGKQREKVTGVVYRGSDSTLKEVRGKLTIVCDGCFSRFREGLVKQEPHTTSRFVGIILENCTLPYPNHGHVFLVAPAPVLAYQIGSNETRLLVDIPNGVPGTSGKELVDFLKERTAPQLPPTMREALLKTLATQQPRSMPNSALHPLPLNWPANFVLLGDAFNMRHPLTGGGMSVALWDVVILRDLFAKINVSDPEAIDQTVKIWQKKRYARAATVNILAHALYTLFSSGQDSALGPMRDACLSYFRLGGICASGPMNLLAITNPKPLSLMTHFFLVALYGVLYSLFPLPFPWKVWKAVKLLFVACWVFFPVATGEKMFSAH